MTGQQDGAGRDGTGERATDAYWRTHTHSTLILLSYFGALIIELARTGEVEKGKGRELLTHIGAVTV